MGGWVPLDHTFESKSTYRPDQTRVGILVVLDEESGDELWNVQISGRLDFTTGKTRHLVCPANHLSKKSRREISVKRQRKCQRSGSLALK